MLGSELGGGSGLVGVVTRDVDDLVPFLGVGEGEVGVSVAENVGALGEEVGVGFATVEDGDGVLSVEELLDDRATDKLGSTENKDIHALHYGRVSYNGSKMAEKPSEYITPRRGVVLLWVGVILLVVSCCGIDGYFSGRASYESNRQYARNCLSNIKQIGLAAAMYGGDNDNLYPPYLTFESNQMRDQFVASITPYMGNNRELLTCNAEREPDKGLEFKPGMEGDPKVMSFVHPVALKGVIPGFSEGNRVISWKDVKTDSKNIVYLRDPIRGFGHWSRSDSDESGNSFKSPHGSTFRLGFLDGHAKIVSHLDINMEL